MRAMPTHSSRFLEMDRGAKVGNAKKFAKNLEDEDTRYDKGYRATLRVLPPTSELILLLSRPPASIPKASPSSKLQFLINPSDLQSSSMTVEGASSKPAGLAQSNQSATWGDQELAEQLNEETKRNYIKGKVRMRQALS